MKRVYTALAAAALGMTLGNSVAAETIYSSDGWVDSVGASCMVRADNERGSATGEIISLSVACGLRGTVNCTGFYANDTFYCAEISRNYPNLEAAIQGAYAFLADRTTTENRYVDLPRMTFFCRDFRTMDNISQSTAARELTIEMTDIMGGEKCNRLRNGGSFRVVRWFEEVSRVHHFMEIADRDDNRVYVFLEEGL